MHFDDIMHNIECILKKYIGWVFLNTTELDTDNIDQSIKQYLKIVYV